MHTYYLHLGSNQGNRKENLLQCMDLIAQNIGKVREVSSIYETEPWGLKDQPSFLNLALSCQSALAPNDLIVKSKAIEARLGKPKEIQWGPRFIDIDILYCDDIILDGDLKIPHREIANRNFVLLPMIEIAGDHVDPVHQKTIDELYDECEDTCEVYLYDGEE